MSITINNETARGTRIRAMRQRTAELTRESTYWTEDDKDTLKKLFDMDIGITDIALELQRSENAVMQQINVLDLYTKARRTASQKKKGECLCQKCSLKNGCDRCTQDSEGPRSHC